MSTATVTKAATCTNADCGKQFQYEPVVFRGNELAAPSICGECEEEVRKREEAEQHAEMRQRRFVSRVQSAKLPKLLQGVSYPEKTPDLVRAWGAGEIDGLCLTGSFGVGKTHLAAAACWDRLHREPIRWVSVAHLLTQLRMGFGEQESVAARAVIAGKGGLVLDDLDKVNPTEYGKEVLFAAIEARVQEGAPLLLTTNLTLNSLGDRLGGAVASRVAGHCKVLRVEGRDRRLDG